ncbi:MAG TPA: serine/threonine-protein kinase [Thermoanaerobaculia bacterium]|nr:serine/threonine-protein kinase [Thermoanaerobaculia bacterium]
MLHCPGCSTSLHEGDHTCPACGMPVDGTSAPTLIENRGLRPVPAAKPAEDEPRFSPGELLVDRYRVVAFLGHGGMGEVYRVEDLKLGQTVALKFLPESLARDGAALARFHREVRLARQISHPNVCRVFDVGEARGRPFLSMEHIDGEDLCSLLRQVGRLSPDKAVEISYQLCAGLAAIHDAGVLHRDLKPANVMIDARGRARITDFGVAALAGELGTGEAYAGTPAYMAPEQIADGEVSDRSDLYSLGLVLYEMFTGRRPFDLPKLADPTGSPMRARPVAPSSLVGDIDPGAERIILRCLEHDPRDRPASALTVARALPGGDLLAAALAAGETPSPEMVATAPKVGSLTPAVAGICLAGALLGLGAVLFLSGRVMAFRQVPLPYSPEVLADRARTLLKSAGFRETPAATSYGFELQGSYLEYLLQRSGSGDEIRHALERGRPPLYTFSYRETFGSSAPARPGKDPPWTGEVRVVLDPEGRLYALQVLPSRTFSSSAPVHPVRWEPLLRAAGLDPARLSAVEPLRVPAVFADSRVAWEGVLPGHPFPNPVRIEAAAHQGRPVSFEIVGPWTGTPPAGLPAWALGGSSPPLFTPAGVVNLLMLLIVLGMARRNLRLGRGDLNGAWRLVFFSFSVSLFGWAFGPTNVPILSEISSLLGSMALFWFIYIAVEPLARRHWPRRMVSWTRLLAGHPRDPMVGRDLLVGCLYGLAMSLTFLSEPLIAESLGYKPRLRLLPTESLLGFSGLARSLSADWAAACTGTLGALVLLLILKILFRNRERWTVMIFGVFLLFLFATSSHSSQLWLAVLFAGIKAGLWISIWLRFGLLCDLTGKLVFGLLLNHPLSPDFSSWYSGSSLFCLLAVAGLAMYGFATATLGQSWQRSRLAG